MQDAQSTIKRGLLWLGSANLVMRLIELASTVVVLWFLGKDDVGLATMAWSVAIIVESFNGLGVGVAMVQAEKVDREQLDSIFWYCAGLAAAVVLATWFAAPWMADFYDEPVLIGMIRVSSLRLPCAALALVSLQTLNRDLCFREVATVQSIAAGLAATAKVGLAAGGFGAWALVIGHVAEGLFTLLGAQVAAPFLPRSGFSLQRIRPMVRFGLKAASSSIVYQSYRNLDFFVVGKLWGQQALGLYRVAFDLAMIPATALMDVVNRTAFPTYSRIGVSQPERLRDAYLWLVRSLALMVGPVTVFVALAADPLLALIAEGRFRSAAPLVQILCVAAFLRTQAQLVPQLLHATGRPGLAFFDSVVTGLAFAGVATVLVHFVGTSLGPVTVSIAWIVAYSVALVFLVAFARLVIPLGVLALLRTLVHPVTGIVLIGGGLLALGVFDLSRLASWQLLGVDLFVALVVCACYYRFGLGLRPRDVLPGSGKA
jgi:O-antigen/teichoic acid export membrane protein